NDTRCSAGMSYALPRSVRTLAQPAHVDHRVEVEDARNPVDLDDELIDAAVQRHVTLRLDTQHAQDRILLGHGDDGERRLGRPPVAGGEHGVDETAEPVQMVLGLWQALELLQRDRSNEMGVDIDRTPLKPGL